MVEQALYLDDLDISKVTYLSISYFQISILR